MSWQTFKFDKIFLGTLDFRSGYSGITANCFQVNTRRKDIPYKLAVFKSEGGGNALQHLAEKLRYASPYTGSNIYIMHACRTSRVLIRNSGYKVVRSVDKADWVIIPAHYKPNSTYKCNLISAVDEKLYLWNVVIDNQTWNNEHALSYPSFNIEQLKARLSLHTFLTDDIKESITVQLFPKDDEVTELFNGAYSNKKLIKETRLSLNCPVEINPETLTIWKNCRDGDIITRAICNSDWQKYPFTLLYFFHNELSEFTLIRGGENFKLVLKEIGYDSNEYSLGEMLRNRIITPEDFNMLQSYIYYKYKLSEDGGFLSTNEALNIKHYDEVFLRKQIMYAPLKLTEPVTYDNLNSLLGREVL